MYFWYSCKGYINFDHEFATHLRINTLPHKVYTYVYSESASPRKSI